MATQVTKRASQTENIDLIDFDNNMQAIIENQTRSLDNEQSISAISQGTGEGYTTRAVAMAEDPLPANNTPFVIHGEPGFNGQYFFNSVETAGYSVVEIFISKAESGDAMVGSAKFSNDGQIVTKLKTEVSTANVDDADQTKFAQAAMVKAEQVARISEINKIAIETNLLKTSKITDGSRVGTTGNILDDANTFRSDAVPVTVGKRYATVSSDPAVFPTFVFYNSATIGSASFISRTQLLSATVPSGATHMLFYNNLTEKSTFILQQLDSGFPTLGQVTLDYRGAYTTDETFNKTEITSNIENSVNASKTELYESIDKIATETDIIKIYGTFDGSRVDNSGNISADPNAFRSVVALPVVVGKRYAVISSNVGENVTFAFYNSSTIGSASFISNTSGQFTTVPSGTTHMVFWTVLSIKSTLIIQQLDSGFPTLGMGTFIYSDVYKRSETYGKTETYNKTESNSLLDAKLDIVDYSVELNYFKSILTVDGSRVSNAGDILADPGTFRTNSFPVVVGERFSTICDEIGLTFNFAFYSSATVSSANLVIRANSTREATVPSGATHMLIYGTLSQKVSSILMQLDSGFPILSQKTIELKDTYTKEEIDKDFNSNKWYPEVFDDMGITYTASNAKIFVVTSKDTLDTYADDTLFGSNGFRTIIKATNTDLSDVKTVCTLDTSKSVLTKLIFINPTKAVGYVQNPETASAEGFYVFENADTDSWSQRKTGVMQWGFPAMNLQGMILCSTNGYLFACSYALGAGKDVAPFPNEIYRSIDSGENWTIVYTHSATANTHMHAIEFDKYRERVWCVIGDEDSGGRPGWAYSDDYGNTWDFVENDDASGQTPFMETAIIPTRKYVLFGSDHHPAGIRKWEPKNDVKNAVVLNSDVTTSYFLPVETTDNFGIAKNPVVDTSSYPYRICLGFSHNVSYAKAAFFISPNFKDWYMMNLVDDPQNTPSVSGMSGITSDGTVIGWCSLTGTSYYFTFKFPNWIKN
jgi:hypothetical protein